MVEKNKKYKTRNVIIWVVSLTIVVILISSLLFIKQDQIDLGCHFIYDEEHHCITAHQIGLLFPFIIKQQPERKNIPPEVIDYVYNDSFILVKQKPKIPLEQIYYDSNDILYPNSPNSEYYWIIDKRNGYVIGPLSYIDYCSKCKEYEIEIDLNGL